VLEATRALLADGGYEALTMKAIAARADVAVGSLYQFFASKQEVVGALGQGYLEEVEQVVQVLSARRFRSWERALAVVRRRVVLSGSPRRLRFAKPATVRRRPGDETASER